MDLGLEGVVVVSENLMNVSLSDYFNASLLFALYLPLGSHDLVEDVGQRCDSNCSPHDSPVHLLYSEEAGNAIAHGHIAHGHASHRHIYCGRVSTDQSKRWM